MTAFEIVRTQGIHPTRPILIEGLPGIGLVGKIATRYLVKELRARKFARLYSDTFPPQITIKKSGLIKDMNIEFYYWKSDGRIENDLIFVVGNSQATSPEGQYAITAKILEVLEEYNIELIYTLGGLSVGKPVEKPKVMGAVTSSELLEPMKELGIISDRKGEGNIIGVSGLLLSMGKRKGIDGACLMGETSGLYVDPNSSKVVLEALSKLIGLDIPMDRLSTSIKESKKKMAEAQKLEREIMEDMGMVQREPSDEEMRYIG